MNRKYLLTLLPVVYGIHRSPFHFRTVSFWNHRIYIIICICPLCFPIINLDEIMEKWLILILLFLFYLLDLLNFPELVFHLRYNHKYYLIHESPLDKYVFYIYPKYFFSNSSNTVSASIVFAPFNTSCSDSNIAWSIRFIFANLS